MRERKDRDDKDRSSFWFSYVSRGRWKARRQIKDCCDTSQARNDFTQNLAGKIEGMTIKNDTPVENALHDSVFG
jgi:hypothetical protein